MVHGSHDPVLVGLSVLIAFAASYTALDLVGQSRDLGEKRRWYLVAALVLGSGIWSMHFVGMLAYTLPLEVTYDPVITALSLVLPIVVTGLGFRTVERFGASLEYLLAGGVIMGLGIVSMHYTGMAAMRVSAQLVYDPAWVAVSVLIALAAASAALWIAFQRIGTGVKIVAALAMGIAIAGMHYSAMQAAHFHAVPGLQVSPGSLLRQDRLALAVALAAFAIFTISLTAASSLRQRAEAALSASETRLTLFVQHAPAAIAMFDLGLHCLYASKRWHEMFASAHSPAHANSADKLAKVVAEVQARAILGEVVRVADVAVDDLDSARWNLEAWPWKDGVGNIAGVLMSVEDVTERRRSELASARLASMTAAAPYAAIALDLEGIITAWNGAAERLFGFPAAEAVGKPKSIIYPEGEEAEAGAILECVRQGEFVEVDTHRRRKDGQRVDVNVAGAPIRNAVGDIIGMTFLISDIRARKQAEERIRNLMLEVNHRSKNLLAIVQAIARNTLGQSDPAVLRAFEERLMALAANQDLLVSSDWKGVDLESLVHSQLALVSDHLGKRIAIQGPAIQIRPQAAQGVGLAVHELTTNAIKYGALSNDSGRIDIWWTLDDQFRLHWIESGGPAVTQPQAKGFGSNVLTRMTSAVLGGTVDYTFPAAGIEWTLTAPASEVLDRPIP